jgi:hypothetical protein
MLINFNTKISYKTYKIYIIDYSTVVYDNIENVIVIQFDECRNCYNVLTFVIQLEYSI